VREDCAGPGPAMKDDSRHRKEDGRCSSRGRGGLCDETATASTFDAANEGAMGYMGLSAMWQGAWCAEEPGIHGKRDRHRRGPGLVVMKTVADAFAPECRRQNIPRRRGTVCRRPAAETWDGVKERDEGCSTHCAVSARYRKRLAAPAPAHRRAFLKPPHHSY
jgi:hypothetical protein